MTLPNSFSRLRADLVDVLRDMGAETPPPLKHLILVPEEGYGDPITLPLFGGPKLDPAERVIVETIRTAGEPLQQKEIADKADLGIRTVQRLTAPLVKRGILLRHPTLGFYLPGMTLKDFPP